MAACSSASPTSADVSVPRVWPRCTKSSRTDGMVADADRWVEVPAAVTKDPSRGGVTRGWRHPDAGEPVPGLGFWAVVRPRPVVAVRGRRLAIVTTEIE